MASSEQTDGFEFISPWMPAKVAEGFYILALSAKHGRMWRWRFWRKHEQRQGGKPWVMWVLDESSANVKPGSDDRLLAESETFDDPRRMLSPRDKSAAGAVVLKRWQDIQASAVGKVPEWKR